MAKTIKAVRRNRGSCICGSHRQTVNLEPRQYEEGICKCGYCFVARCPDCRGALFSVGPIACYCDGAPRRVRHGDMGQLRRWDMEKAKFVKIRASVKPSVARRRNS